VDKPHAAVTTASDEEIAYWHHARDCIHGGLRLRAHGASYACAEPADKQIN